MIGRLAGTLANKSSPPTLLVDVHGVGYEVDVPMSTFFVLPAAGQPVTLLTHFVVREDAQLLYGFLTDGERATFRLLVKISGVGPDLALPAAAALSDSHGDIVQALIALGYSEREAQAALKALPADVGVAEGIKLALKALNK